VPARDQREQRACSALRPRRRAVWQGELFRRPRHRPGHRIPPPADRGLRRGLPALAVTGRGPTTSAPQRQRKNRRRPSTFQPAGRSTDALPPLHALWAAHGCPAQGSGSQGASLPPPPSCPTCTCTRPLRAGRSTGRGGGPHHRFPASPPPCPCVHPGAALSDRLASPLSAGAVVRGRRPAAASVGGVCCLTLLGGSNCRGRRRRIWGVHVGWGVKGGTFCCLVGGMAADGRLKKGPSV